MIFYSGCIQSNKEMNKEEKITFLAEIGKIKGKQKSAMHICAWVCSKVENKSIHNRSHRHRNQARPIL